MEDNLFSLSAVMITKNAAASIERSLASLASVVDEIVIVDSGSTDDTLSIAQQFNANIVYQQWLGFGLQKQFAVNYASSDWVLCIDADEWLSDELQKSIGQLRHRQEAHVYQLCRKNCFMGRFLRHGEAYPDKNIRLFHRHYAKWTDDVVHEKVISAAIAHTLKGDLLHDSAESLDSYLDKQNRYTTLQAKEIVSRQQKPVSAAKAVLSALFRFMKGYIFRMGFLDGFPGFVHIVIASSNSFFKYSKAIDLIKEGKKAQKNTTQ